MTKYKHFLDIVIYYKNFLTDTLKVDMVNVKIKTYV